MSKAIDTIKQTDPRRWVIVLIFVLAGVLAVTDVELQSIGHRLDRNNNSTIQNRKIGCFNAEAVNQVVPPGCEDLHIPIPAPPPPGVTP